MPAGDKEQEWAQLLPAIGDEKHVRSLEAFLDSAEKNTSAEESKVENMETAVSEVV